MKSCDVKIVSIVKMSLTQENARICIFQDSYLVRLFTLTLVPIPHYTLCLKRRKYMPFPLQMMIKWMIFTQRIYSPTQHTNTLFQSASPLFLTLLFYLRDNVKGIEHCEWIMVSCCKINAQAFIENKCWEKAKTFIFKVENYFLVTTFSARDIITILPNDFLSKLRSPSKSNRIPICSHLYKR